MKSISVPKRSKWVKIAGTANTNITTKSRTIRRTTSTNNRTSGVSYSDSSISIGTRLNKWLIKAFVLVGIMFLVIVFETKLSAETFTCPKVNIFAGLLQNVPYSSSLPIYLGGGTLGNGNASIPDTASHKSICSCKSSKGLVDPGVVLGMWEPAYLIEFVREHSCSPVLGVELPLPTKTKLGTTGSDISSSNEYTFYHVHLYSFPLYSMMNLFSDLKCGSQDYMDMDLLYASELDPSWNDEYKALLEFPETSALASVNAVESCSYDALKSMNGVVDNGLYYCAGSWGYMYPLSGYTPNLGSPAENTSLLASKLLYMLHRRLLLKDFIGDNALCGAYKRASLNKEAYRFSLVYPVPETSNSHALGEPVANWLGDSRVPPGFHDVVYMVWRYKNCCLGAYS